MSLAPRTSRLRGLAMVALGPLVAALTVVGLVSAASPAAACSCVSGSLRQLAAHSDVAFVGTVRTAGDGDRTGRYDVDVERVYRGDVEDPADVQAGFDTSACALGGLTIGDRWLFLTGEQTSTGYVASSCSGSQRVGPHYDRRLRPILGAGTGTGTGDATPGELTDSVGEPDSSSVLTGVVGLVALAAVIGAWLLFRHARRPR